MNWQLFVHTTPAGQRVSKLSHYYSYTYFRIIDLNSSVKSMPMEVGLKPTGRRLPTWGVCSHPTMVGVPMQLQNASTTSQQKRQ